MTVKKVLRKILRLDDEGKEVLDNTPVAVPLKFQRSPEDNLNQRMREMIQQAMSSYATANGAETWEEADDFEVEDGEPFSPYESQFEGVMARKQEIVNGYVEERPAERSAPKAGEGKPDNKDPTPPPAPDVHPAIA